ncbi:MAG: carbon storage regulator [Deltaproteobacteria bacterium]
MLVISRRKGQRVSIGDEIELVITEVHRSSVKLGIRAPRGLTVLRGEIRDSIEEANRAAAQSSLEDTGALGPPARPAEGTAISAISVTVLRRPGAGSAKDPKPV